GTPAFMAPEQAAGRIADIDTRSDVYALGVITYRLLTGESPHDLTGGRLDVLMRIVETDVRRPAEMSRAIDGELEALLLKSLAKDPNGRYASAGDFADDIHNYLIGEPLAARTPTTMYFLRKRLKRYRVPITIAVTMAIVIISLAATWLVRERDLRVEAQRLEKKASDEAKKARDAEADALTAEGISREAEAKAKHEAAAARRSLYFNKVALALQYVEGGDLDRANALLDESPKELRSWEWYYLKHEARTLELEISGCTGPLALRPDGRILAARVSKGPPRLALYEMPSGRLLRMIDMSKKRLSHVAFSRNGKMIVTGDASGTLKVWNSVSGQLMQTFETGQPSWRDVAFSTNGKYVFSASPLNAKVWDLANGGLYHALPDLQKPIEHACLSRDGNRIAVLQRDLLRIWDLSEKKWLAQTRDGPHVHGNGLAYALGDRSLVMVKRSGTYWLYDPDDLSVQGFRRTNANRHYATAISGETVALNVGSRTIVMDLVSGRTSGVYASRVGSVAIADSRIAMTGPNGVVQVRRRVRLQRGKLFHWHEVTAVALDPA
ncbi:MAG: hypothetical protein QGF59_09180, partial [Pirellulaceae bacterium]|nr:hypothetical protein [Pirellulaceae bacterium]